MPMFKTITFLALSAVCSATFTCPEPVNPLATSASNACCKELIDLNFEFQGTELYFGKSCSKASVVETTGPRTAVTDDCPADTEPGCCDPTLFELTGWAPCTGANSTFS